jgi:hypothetical protein
MVALAFQTTSCRSGRRDPDSMASARLISAGERDTAYVRQVRMFEEVAAHIPTDSLARLYVGALDAPAERGGAYQFAIACQYYRMVTQYGPIASPKAIRRMEDSLFTTPAARERWTAAISLRPSRRMSGCALHAQGLMIRGACPPARSMRRARALASSGTMRMQPCDAASPMDSGSLVP